MRRTFETACAVSVIMILLACRCVMEEETCGAFTDGTIEGGAYDNSVLGIAVSAPAGWNMSIPAPGAQEEFPLLLVISDKTGSGSDFAASVNMVAGTVSGSSQCEDFFGSIEQEYHADPNWHNVLFYTSKSIQLDGENACEIQFTGTFITEGDSLALRISQVFLVREEYLILLTFTDLAANFNPDGDFASIRESIQLVPMCRPEVLAISTESIGIKPGFYLYENSAARGHFVSTGAAAFIDQNECGGTPLIADCRLSQMVQRLWSNRCTQ